MEYENNCDGDNKFSEGCVENMPPIDLDTVDVILDQHGKQLDKFDTRIRVLEIEFAKNNETLNNVKQGQESLKKSMDKIEGQMLTNHNAMLSGLNSLIINKNDNSTKVEVAKIDGKSKIYIQIILFFGGLATVGGSVYMAMK